MKGAGLQRVQLQRELDRSTAAPIFQQPQVISLIEIGAFLVSETAILRQQPTEFRIQYDERESFYGRSRTFRKL